MYKIIYILLFVSFFINSCGVNERDLNSAILKASSVEEAGKYAKKIEQLEMNALPIFIFNLTMLQKNEHKLSNYGKIDICLSSLLTLAEKGIYSKEEGLFLIEVITSQKSISSTLKTAKILKIITDIDVGYDQKFVESYTDDKENIRRGMIEIWRKKLAN